MPQGKCCASDVQLFQIAVGNIVAAPIRNSIELDAVRELHLVLGFKPLELAVSLQLYPGLTVGGVFASSDRIVVNKLNALRPARILHDDGTARVSVCAPSSPFAVAGRGGRVVGFRGSDASASKRGGITEMRGERNCGSRAEAAVITQGRYMQRLWSCDERRLGRATETV